MSNTTTNQEFELKFTTSAPLIGDVVVLRNNHGRTMARFAVDFIEWIKWFDDDCCCFSGRSKSGAYHDAKVIITKSGTRRLSMMGKTARSVSTSDSGIVVS